MQLFRRLPARIAQGDQVKDLFLSRAQAGLGFAGDVAAMPGGPALKEDLGMRCMEVGATLAHRTNGREQLDVCRSFQHISRATSRQHLSQVALIVVHREDQHPRRTRVPDLAENFQTTHLWHGQIQKHDIRNEFAGQRQRIHPVSCLADHLHVAFGIQKQAQAGAQHCVVIHDQDTDG